MTGSQPGVGLTLHSSWWGIMSGVISSIVMCALGVWGVASVGSRPVPVVLVVVGLLLGLVVVFDLPIAAHIDHNGIERRAMLRRHRLGWGQIRAISRGRPAIRIRRRDLDPGPLVAVVGRRRYMVIDQTESLSEYQDLISILRSLDRVDDLELLLPPPDGRPPTWVYRHRRWRQR